MSPCPSKLLASFSARKERGRGAHLGMSRGKRRKHLLRPLRRRLAWPFEALALAAFWQICALLPPDRATALGRGLLRVLGPWLTWHRQLRSNLAVALADGSPARTEELAREAWGNFGAT